MIKGSEIQTGFSMGYLYCDANCGKKLRSYEHKTCTECEKKNPITKIRENIAELAPLYDSLLSNKIAKAQGDASANTKPNTGAVSPDKEPAEFDWQKYYEDQGASE